MLDVQARAVRWLLERREERPEDAVVVVTHGDVIRALLVYFAGLPLDLIARFEIEPASCTSIVVHPDAVQILRTNWTPLPD